MLPARPASRSRPASQERAASRRPSASPCSACVCHRASGLPARPASRKLSRVPSTALRSRPPERAASCCSRDAWHSAAARMTDAPGVPRCDLHVGAQRAERALRLDGGDGRLGERRSQRCLRLQPAGMTSASCVASALFCCGAARQRAIDEGNRGCAAPDWLLSAHCVASSWLRSASSPAVSMLVLAICGRDGDARPERVLVELPLLRREGELRRERALQVEADAQRRSARGWVSRRIARPAPSASARRCASCRMASCGQVRRRRRRDRRPEFGRALAVSVSVAASASAMGVAVQAAPSASERD